MKRLFLLLAGLPSAAFAEVSDKVQGYQTMWVVGLLLSVVFSLLCYWRRGFVLVACLASLLIAYSYYEMSADAVLNTLVEKEMGSWYFISGYSTSLLILLSSVWMAVLGSRKKAGV